MMYANAAVVAALCAPVAGRLQLRAVGADAEVQGNPVNKVVSLLTEMQAQVQKEAEEDKQAYEKYGCWCTANRDAKTEAVAAAEKRMAQLESFLEEVVGTQAQLRTEITSLEASIVEDQDALTVATEIRSKELEAFRAEEKDTMETIETMRQALEVLAKVQFLQHKKGLHRAAPEVKPLLLQLHNVLEGVSALDGVHAHIGAFRDVMQRDLWDMMSSVDEAAEPAGSRLAVIEQRGQLRSGQSPEGLVGNAAGASSYNARSRGIYGMLSEMKEEFERNLAANQKIEVEALIAYQRLRSAKLAEISAAQTSKVEKQERLADSVSKAAQAREDLIATREALGADQQFLLGLEQNCKTNEEGYPKRAKLRSEELAALAEAIKVLTTDEARDVFIKTMSPTAVNFLQAGSVQHHSGSNVIRFGSSGQGRAATEAEAKNAAVNAAMQRILRVATKHKNWLLASLAVHVRLDAFTKVKEAMDKMTAQLKAQQREEFEKKDFCNQQIDETEDSITEKKNDHEDLQGQRLGLENSIATLQSDLDTLRTELAQTRKSLKEAGEDRSGENKIFQQAIADQRATANILNKAKARLAKFYAQRASSLLQHAAGQPNTPGQALAPPPPKSNDYSKSAGAGGVLQLLDIILTDAAKEEAELLRTEQYAQKQYEQLVKDMNNVITADEAAVAEKTKRSAQASSARSEAEAGLLANEQDAMTLDETLKGMHLDCDYLLKYYGVRQQARQEELDAIAEAKAVLSGADFGHTTPEA